MPDLDTSVRDALDAAACPVIWVSGGKDSLALLHLCRPWRHRLTVVHTVVDGSWPGLTATVERCMDAWGFLRSVYTVPTMPFAAYTARYGWPTAIVPTSRDGAQITPYFVQGAVQFSSWWHCTYTRRILPLMAATATLRADLVLTGALASDMPLIAAGGPRVDAPALPWVRLNPLYAWTDDDVYTYVEAHAIPLPPHYALKRAHRHYQWPECLSCTWQPEHWQTLKTHYPDEYAARWPTVAPVFAVLRTELDGLQTRLKELRDGE